MSEPGSREHVLSALKPLGPIMAKPALGGIGLQLNGLLFGVLHGGSVYLKVDKGLREEYHAAGMPPFEPRPKQKLDAFLQVPLEVAGDERKLLEHAARAAGRPAPPPPAAVAATSATSEEEAPEPAPEPAPKARSAGKTPEKPAAKPRIAGKTAEKTAAKPRIAGKASEKRAAKAADPES